MPTQALYRNQRLRVRARKSGRPAPRVYRDKLWVLNSGTGEFGWVETGKTGKFHPITFCPGFVRGLAFHGKFAFIGLPKPRYERGPGT